MARTLAAQLSDDEPDEGRDRAVGTRDQAREHQAGVTGRQAFSRCLASRSVSVIPLGTTKVSIEKPPQQLMAAQ